MGSAHIDVWAKQAIENFPDAPGDKPAHRRRRALDDAIFQLAHALRSTIRINTNRKGLGDHVEDVKQYAYIAILQALRTWDPSKSCFNTYVHWKMRGEFATAVQQLLPERRKVKTIVPVQTISMDMEMGGGDLGEGLDLHGILADENATDDIERNCATMRFMEILDRYFSHKFAAKDPVRDMVDVEADALTIAHDAARPQRGRSMRDRDMYLRHHFSGETLDQIGRAHNLTRERVRQITTKIDADIRQYFPDPRNPRSVAKPIKNHLHPLWSEYLAAWEEYQRTMVTVANETAPLLPEHEADAVPAIVEVLEPEQMEIDLPMPAAPVRETVSNVIVCRDPRPNAPMPAIKRSLTVLVAGMSMMSAAASAQTSRAIPPEDVQSAQMADDDGVPPVAKTRRHASPAPRARVQTVRILKLDNLRAPVQRWGVAVAEYPDVASMQRDWGRKRASWNMLAGLYPGAVPSPERGGYRLIFGPVEKGQAEGLCHEAKRAERPCVVTTFGGVRTAKPGDIAQTGGQRPRA